MEEERDFVVFTDDDGNEFELDVIDYFTHEDQDYAVLMDLTALAGEPEDGDEETEQDVYIMKLVVNGDEEEFLPADDDMMDVLAAIVESRLSECECDECDDDCDCEEHEHDCGCGCGCHEHND